MMKQRLRKFNDLGMANKPSELSQKILEGFCLAYYRLVEERRKTKEPLLLYIDGKVVRVDPNTIKLDKEK